ncbi:hypothetical protein B0H19DRAFT_1072510 [Mycena capillaripes]|nr:hypothetical protein B0H19DRAFT_1072510 [Mycena capillaripes]
MASENTPQGAPKFSPFAWIMGRSRPLALKHRLTRFPGGHGGRGGKGGKKGGRGGKGYGPKVDRALFEKRPINLHGGYGGDGGEGKHDDGGDAGDGLAPEIVEPLLETEDPAPWSLTVKSFCDKYDIDKNIRSILEKESIKRVAVLCDIRGDTLRDSGMGITQIVELKTALKLLARTKKDTGTKSARQAI